MHFDSCSWVATAKSLKIYAVCYETTGDTKYDVEHLMDVLTKEYSSLEFDRITDEEVKLQRLLATNELCCIVLDILDRNRMYISPDLHVKLERQFGTNELDNAVNAVSTLIGCRSCKVQSRVNAMHLQRIMKRDNERWVLRLKIDEHRNDWRRKYKKDPAVIELIKGCFAFGRKLFPNRKRHVAVLERMFEGEKEKMPGCSTHGNLNRVGVILIAWDDDLVEENTQESRLCPELPEHAENK